jgi:hypothetical protein
MNNFPLRVFESSLKNLTYTKRLGGLSTKHEASNKPTDPQGMRSILLTPIISNSTIKPIKQKYRSRHCDMILLTVIVRRAHISVGMPPVDPSGHPATAHYQ